MQFGVRLRAGDEVVITTQDYPRMLMGWDQRARPDGIVVKQVSYPTPPPSMEDLYDRVVAAVTARTRVIHVSHMTYTAGQIFPLRRLTDFARSRGIYSVVDGGHTFGRFPFTREALGCDFYGTSLHSGSPLPEDFRKFEQIGTYPISLRNSVSDALTFHEAIGFERKAARFRYLRERWMRGIEDAKGVRLLTS